MALTVVRAVLLPLKCPVKVALMRLVADEFAAAALAVLSLANHRPFQLPKVPRVVVSAARAPVFVQIFLFSLLFVVPPKFSQGAILYVELC